MKIGLDTETTGLDLYHGATPFLFTTCDEEGTNTFYEWNVDPFIRIPEIPKGDVDEIQQIIDDAELIYCQNGKFDFAGLRKIGIKNWDWSKVRDTLYGGHLLASNQPHDLTSMALIYLGVNIKPYEDAVIEACKQSRMMAGRKDFIERHGEWLLAAEGVEGMPSAGEKNHKYDMWLPRVIALAEGYDEDHPWWNVTNQYANPDSSVVLPLGIEIERRIEQAGLWPIYEERLKLLPVVSAVELNGVTLNGQRLSEQRADYQAESDRYAKICVNIAESYGHQLELPRGSSVNNSMRKFCFETLELPVNKLTKKAKQPSLDKDVLATWAATLPSGNKPFTFVNSVVEMRGLNNAISYMDAYERYWVKYGFASETEAEHQDRGGVLDLDDVQVHKGVRATASVGRIESPSNQLQSVQGGNPGGNVGTAQLRQSKLHKPGAPISGNVKGQLGGYGVEGEASNGKSKRVKITPAEFNARRAASHDNAHGGANQGDKKTVHTGEQKPRVSGTSRPVRSSENNDLQNNQKSLLEACEIKNWYMLHPSMNATGTQTLRWSSENPNAQNISKKEKYNVRYSFGPAPGREWWSCDAQNIELRIPAFEANEKDMVYLFNHPDKPPYYGSYHMLVFDVLHPEKFAKHGMKCKEVYESTWYQWTKNGNFATQYGAQEYLGTADRAYHVPGAQARIMGRFQEIKKLSDQYIKMAEACGYVETMPDKSVSPHRGYPLLCTRTKWGKIKPTVPLSYHVQGTAMWWMMKAMIRCHEYLGQVSKERGKKYFITLQVHDELVFDFPKGRTSTENLPIVKECMRLMAMGGDDLGLPTPVSCKYHPVSWSDGKKVSDASAA